jgi:hypothetical protein
MIPKVCRRLPDKWLARAAVRVTQGQLSKPCLVRWFKVGTATCPQWKRAAATMKAVPITVLRCSGRFSHCEWFPHFAGVLNENLRDRAERAVLWRGAGSADGWPRWRISDREQRGRRGGESFEPGTKGRDLQLAATWTGRPSLWSATFGAIMTT